MKKSAFAVCSIAIASLGFSSLGLTQPARQETRQEARQEAREDAKEAKRDAKEARQDQKEARRHANARGKEFRRGARLPSELRERQYVVTDWRSHRLSAPPKGHQWVQVGSDYVLMAVATGLIADLVLR